MNSLATFSLAVVALAACSNAAPENPSLGFGSGAAAGSGAGGMTPSAGGSSAGAAVVGTGGAGVGGAGPAAGGPSIELSGGAAGMTVSGVAGNADLCATVTASATLEPVFLTFAFDVSGSMGKGDYPWHDATLKWDPVVAATRGFFEDPKSSGLSASLTAFPIDASDNERCDPDSYTDPDVAMTALPSTAFGEALDAIRQEDWRGGTPTLAVVEGVLSTVDAYRAEHPGHYVLVLVTDGYPQDCDDDSIESVEDAVRAVAGDIPTYVIGVGDATGDLDALAKAGGTTKAFSASTSTPSQTGKLLSDALTAIRTASVSCNFPIPAAPAGQTIDFNKVNVEVTTKGTPGTIKYSPDCADATGWKYDDANKPTKIELCDTSCGTIKADAYASVGVVLGCATEKAGVN